MQFVEKTGKTIDEAVEAALADLGVARDAVTVDVLEESKGSLFGLFGSKQAKVRVTVNEVAKAPEVKPTETEVEAAVDNAQLTANNDEAVAVAKEFLKDMLAKMNMDVVIEKFYNKQENTTELKLHGKDMGVLIGKHGQTLDALQYLTNLVANKHAQERVRIQLDIEQYRERRRETLVSLAKRLAERVKRTGEKLVLEPMNPYERKVIHMTLQDDDKITTYSEGEEPYRKTVIDLK